MLRVTGSRILGILFSSMEEEDIFFFLIFGRMKKYTSKNITIFLCILFHLFLCQNGNGFSLSLCYKFFNGNTIHKNLINSVKSITFLSL